MGKNILGYVFHFLDGHTDRVWATCRGKESPTSVGHCFVCHTFFEREGYKTIEEATAAHVCNPSLGKERAKRSGTHLTAHLPAVGGAGTVTHLGPHVTVDEEFLLKKYKEHGKSFEYEYTEDCVVDVRESLDLVFEKAFKYPSALETTKKLAAELASRASTMPVTSINPAAEVLQQLKQDSKFLKFVTEQDELKRQQALLAHDDDDDTEPFIYTEMEVIKQFVSDAKKVPLIQRQKKASDEKAHELEKLIGAGLSEKLAQEKYIQKMERELSEANECLRQHRDAIKYLTEKLSRAEDAVRAAPVNAPQDSAAPSVGCTTESTPHLCVEES
jgi:hypothetical protein